jgi:hypothetical protein
VGAISADMGHGRLDVATADQGMDAVPPDDRPVPVGDGSIDRPAVSDAGPDLPAADVLPATDPGMDSAPDVPTLDAAPAEILFVQAAHLVSQSDTQLTLSLPSATASGNLLVVAFALNDDPDTQISSITDDAPGGSSTYLPSGYRSTDRSCADAVDIYYAKNIQGGATALTVNLVGTHHLDMWAMEFSGLSTSDPLDTGGTASEQPAASIAMAPAVTPSAPRALVVSVTCTCNTVDGIAAGNPFTALPVLEGNDAAYFIASEPGTYGAVWNLASGTWDASTVAFK